MLVSRLLRELLPELPHWQRCCPRRPEAPRDVDPCRKEVSQTGGCPGAVLFNPTWDTRGIIDYGGQRKLMLIDGPDGKEITRGGKAHPLRSYSVAELYFGRPLYAVTLFPAFSDLLLSIVRLPERQRGPTVYSGGGRRGGR